MFLIISFRLHFGQENQRSEAGEQASLVDKVIAAQAQGTKFKPSFRVKRQACAGQTRQAGALRFKQGILSGRFMIESNRGTNTTIHFHPLYIRIHTSTTHTHTHSQTKKTPE